MYLIRTISDLRTALRAERSRGKSIGFVPTMAYLHIGLNDKPVKFVLQYDTIGGATDEAVKAYA